MDWTQINIHLINIHLINNYLKNIHLMLFKKNHDIFKHDIFQQLEEIEYEGLCTMRTMKEYINCIFCVNLI